MKTEAFDVWEIIPQPKADILEVRIMFVYF